MLNGFCKVSYSNGTVFEGHFKNNLKHGKGKITFKSGNFYEGGFINDKKEGYGEMHWVQDMEVYKGFWKDNMQEGLG